MGKKSRRKGNNKSSTSKANVHVHHKQGEGTHGHHKYHSGSYYQSHHQHKNGNNGENVSAETNLDENADKNITDQEPPKEKEPETTTPTIIPPVESNGDDAKDPLNESETEIVFHDAISVDDSGLDDVFHVGDVESTPDLTPAVVSRDEEDEPRRDGVALAPILVLPVANAEGDDTVNLDNGPISPDVQNDELLGKQQTTSDESEPVGKATEEAAVAATSVEESKEEITTDEEQLNSDGNEGYEGVVATTQSEADEMNDQEEGSMNLIVPVDQPEEMNVQEDNPDPEQVIDVDTGKPDKNVERRVSFAADSPREQSPPNKSSGGIMAFLGNMRDNARQQVSNKEQGRKTKGKWTTCKILFLVLAVWALAIMIYLLVRDDDKDDNESAGQTPGSSDFANPALDPIYMISQDPFDGETDLSDTNPWPSDGNGVTIQVLNALQKQWTPLYNSALTSWNNGSPRSLRLSSGAVRYDPSCVPVEGFVKICSDDYGPYGWRGRNEVVIRDGFMASSVIKINDFYLADRSDNEKEYVFCHQLGHSWGLVHGNEDFLDEDTNSCMDYTYNYETHKGPNQRDFNVLRFLYGVFPNQNGQRRYLREETVNGVPQFESIADKVESWVEEEIRSLYDRQDGRRLQPRRWQRLNSDSHRETYEADLGRGYKLQIHGLLA